MPELVTERLVIRALGAADAEAVRALTGLGDDWLRWTVLGYQQLAELHQPPYGERAVALRATGEVIGLVGYAPVLAPFALLPEWPCPAHGFTAEVGLYWAIAESHRRRGFAAEAGAALVRYGFDELRLSRIVATTERTNEASMGVMRRLGMRVEHNPHPEPEWFQVVGWTAAPG